MHQRHGLFVQQQFLRPNLGIPIERSCVAFALQILAIGANQLDSSNSFAANLVNPRTLPGL